MSVIFYQGTDIYFRPVEPEDEPKLRRWINDPRVWSTLNHRGPTNTIKQQRWIEQRSGTESHVYTFAIVRAEDNRFVGTCGLHPSNTPTHQAEFGIIIGDTEAQNNGIGSQATALTLRYGFEELNLHRIELTVLANNRRAIRVYERNGFRLEGRHLQATYRHGAYHDVLRYAMLKSEWLERHGYAQSSDPIIIATEDDNTPAPTITSGTHGKHTPAPIALNVTPTVAASIPARTFTEASA